MRVEFDFSALRGRIIEKYGTLAAFAKAINMGRASISQKLGNVAAFKPDEILLICSPAILDIGPDEIGRFFYTPKV